MRVDPYAGIPSMVAVCDRFDDADVDTDIFGSKVENGSTVIAETGGELKISNSGAGTTGTSWLPTKFRWGNFSVINVMLEVVDGEAAGDGERCEASLVLYKDSDNYVRWGVYRDTSEAVNSAAYLRYNIGGAGEVAVDCALAVVDNTQHAFKIIKFESQVELYYDGVYVTGFAFKELINFLVRLEAGTQGNTDKLDVRFDDLRLYNLADPFTPDVITAIDDVDTNVQTLLSRLTSARAGYLDYLASATYGLSALNTDLDAIIASLAGGNVSQGTGTITLTNTNAVAVEFATATYGSVFELTFIANTAKATTGFEARAAADTIMTVKIYKKIEGAYPTLPQDIWAIQKTTTNTRNIDINLVKCGEDTKIELQLDKNPSADVAIPYRWIVRRLKT